MIEYEKMRSVIASGLKNYLNCPVVRANQNDEPPAYPYVSYTITTLMSENNGTYGEYDDGIDRKPITQTWSISAQSDDSSESVMLISKAREWFDRFGTTYLNDNNVIVQSIGSITNRDSILTIEYEYKQGFDIDFWLFETVDTKSYDDGSGTIETAEINSQQESG